MDSIAQATFAWTLSMSTTAASDWTVNCNTGLLTQSGSDWTVNTASDWTVNYRKRRTANTGSYKSIAHLNCDWMPSMGESSRRCASMQSSNLERMSTTDPWESLPLRPALQCGHRKGRGMWNRE